MKEKILKSNILFKSALAISALSIIAITPLSVISCEKTDSILDRPLNWYSPFNTVDGSSNAFANDPCNILYDEETETFYSWMLFRDGKDFPSGWIEMTSKDLNTWTQGEYRIKVHRDFEPINGAKNTSVLGGSVWIDTEGKYFEPGDAVFVVSMQPSKILNPENNTDGGIIGGEGSSSPNVENKAASSSGDGYTTDESGIAYFVSHGLGQDFYKSGVLSKECLNEDGTADWRDTALFQTGDGLYFAISAHNRLEFYKINHFDNKYTIEPKIEKVSELFVRNIGVEVPNIVRLNKDLWYVSASVQDNPFGGPFQSSWWTICRWNEEKGFVPVKVKEDGSYTDIQNIRTKEDAMAVQKEQPKEKVIDWNKSEKYKDKVNVWTPNEYGTEGYAQRVSDPYQTQNNIKFLNKNGDTIGGPEFLISRSMTSNWAYDTDIWSWKGGTFGSEKITINNSTSWKPILEPNDDTVNYFLDNGSAVYKLKGSDLNSGYNLVFDKGSITFYLKDNAIYWDNNIHTGLKKWTKNGGPTNLEDDITIVWNKTTLTFYNNTKAWNAHFMLPQETTHTPNEGAQSLIDNKKNEEVKPSA